MDTTYTFEVTTPDREFAVDIEAVTFESAVEELKVRYPDMTGWHHG